MLGGPASGYWTVAPPVCLGNGLLTLQAPSPFLPRVMERPWGEHPFRSGIRGRQARSWGQGAEVLPSLPPGVPGLARAVSSALA